MFRAFSNSARNCYRAEFWPLFCNLLLRLLAIMSASRLSLIAWILFVLCNLLSCAHSPTTTLPLPSNLTVDEHHLYDGHVLTASSQNCKLAIVYIYSGFLHYRKALIPEGRCSFLWSNHVCHQVSDHTLLHITESCQNLSRVTHHNVMFNV